MSSDFLRTLGNIAFIAVGISALIETILSATWNKIYFSLGLPIFVKRIPVGPHYRNIPPSSQLEIRSHSARTKSLVFHKLDLNTYGFRREINGFSHVNISYLSPMHGVLLFDYDNSEVVVKGFMNWSVLCLWLIWLIIFSSIFPQSIP